MSSDSQWNIRPQDDFLSPSYIYKEIENFLNTYSFIRKKIKNNELCCDVCNRPFPETHPFYVNIDEANEQVLCTPCNYKKLGTSVEQVYEERKKLHQMELKKDNERFEHSKVFVIAKELLSKISPFCEKAMIAGSLRRKQADVGDIEIVALPKIVEQADGLFGDVIKSRHPDFIATAKGFGKIKKGNPETGRYIQFELPEGVKLDLFIPEPYDFFRIFAMRTGSARFSKDKLANGWSRKGWCGTEDGLRLQSECIQKNDKWICNTPTPTLPPEWESEEAFFAWLGIQWTPPENRF